MPRRPQQHHIESLVKRIDAQLRSIGEDFHHATLREKVLHLVNIQHNLRDLGTSLVHEAGMAASSARKRIRLYMTAYVGEVITADELQVVSGISDYSRRIRELRVEHGYQIASGASPDPEVGIDLHPDQYLLLSTEPDADAARRWHVANRIRRMQNTGSRDRLLAFLRENVNMIVTTDELAYVSRTREFGRRVRELRTEQGYLIATRFTGRPDLSIGQYVLESAERVAQPHDRKIPDFIQREVYSRDKNTCICCGWNLERFRREDPRILELHHLEEHVEGGANTAENLAVVCSRCHDEVHAGRLELIQENGEVHCTRITE